MDEEVLKPQNETVIIDEFSDAAHVENKPIDEFLIKNVRQILQALTELQDLDAFEVFIKVPGRMDIERLFRVGHLKDIWSEDAYSGSNSLLRRYLLKGEVRVINLPNRRMESLVHSLKEKAFG